MKEIKKQKVGENVKKGLLKKVVYIPERSFLRKPFDRCEVTMLQLIARNIGRVIDRA